MPTQTGTHFADVTAINGAGTYSLTVQQDSDGDGIIDQADKFPDDPANDADRDGRGANADNCPTVSNKAQTDWDRDRKGDACDRSAKVSVKRLRTKGRKVVLRVTARPTLLKASAIRVSAGSARIRTRVKARGAGRFDVTVAFRRAGSFRVRATLRDTRHTRARSTAIRVRVR